ncbi:MAG: hypothetical protein IMZ69_06890 [Spirochaetes bacterium]|nr:hypothetical protein [Spirochaetota bacterium]
MPDWAVTAAIRANGTQFAAVMKGMGASVSGFASAARTAFERAIPGGRALSKAFSSMAGQVAIGNLLSRGISRIGREIGQLPKQVEDFAKGAGEIARTAGIVGVSTDAWQRWVYTAKTTNTSAEALQGAMQRLNKNMADQTVGKGTLMDLAKFGPRGLAGTIRSTHSATEAMLLLADSFRKVKDPQVRARMAVAAFGKSGQEMIPMLALGRAELVKLMKETDIYGSNITPAAIAASIHLEKTMNRLRGMYGSLKDKVLSTLVTAISPYVDKATEWVRTHEDLIKQKIPEYIDKIVNAAKWLWGAVQKVVDIWNNLNRLANGHLARDILLVVAAWKSVRLAIDLAKAAQIAFGVVAAATGKAGAVGAAASAGAGAAETAIGAGAAKWAGRFAAGGPAAAVLGGAALIPPIAAVVAVGSSLIPLLTDTKGAFEAMRMGKGMAGGNFITNLFTGAGGLGMKMREAIFGGAKAPEQAPNAGQSFNARVNGRIDVYGPKDTQVTNTGRDAPALLGYAGEQYGGGR